MSQRIIKNYTEEDLEIDDLGDVVIPANGALDLGGNEQRLIELASSEDLFRALIQGQDKYQVNDGLRDLSISEGIDLIRKIQRPTEVDELGRWVVRSDSRKNGWDTVFQGSGDDMVGGKIGGGTPFRFDFEAPADDPRWRTPEQDPSIPEGYKRQRLDWYFNDWTYVKEGTIYFYNIPKGSFINMWIVAPAGAPFTRKRLDQYQNLERVNYIHEDSEVPFVHWVVNYPVEGTCPMGDELNTESAAETPAYPGLIWRAEFTIPEVQDWEQAHGHYSLELYRIAQDRLDIPPELW
jgi:hypothetical protein